MLTVDPHGDAAEVPGDPVAAKRSAKTYGRKREPARGEGGRPEEPPAAREPPTRVRADAALHDVSADSLLDLLDGDAPRSAADGSEDALSEPAENNGPSPHDSPTAPGPPVRMDRMDVDDTMPSETEARPADPSPARVPKPPSMSSPSESPEVDRKRRSPKMKSPSPKEQADDASAESESSAAAKDASSKGKKKRRKRILGSSSSEASPVAIKKALPAALPSESDAGDAGSPKDENPPADPEADLGSSQMMPSQPLDPNMDLELHFSDQEELEEEIRRDAENDRRKREAMGLEDDAPIPEIPDDSQVPGEGGEGKAGSASDADAGSGSDDGARKGKHRRLKKLNQKELKELHRESDRLKRTGVVSLEMTVARQLNMRDFLSRFGAGKPKDKQAAPAVESAPSNGAPTVDDLADGVKSGTDGPGGVVPMPHKPALAKAAVIELDDDDPLPARPRAPASRPAAKRVDAVSSLKAKRNAELAKQAELHALRQKEQYKKQKEQVLAAKRAQEKADDRLGMKSGKKGQRPAQGAEPAAETPPEKGEGDAQSEKRDSDLDSGDEDIVNAGLPESERRGKRKLHRKRRAASASPVRTVRADSGRPSPARTARSPSRVASILVASPELAKPAADRVQPASDSEEDTDPFRRAGFPASMSSKVLQAAYQPPPESNSLLYPFPGLDSDGSGDDEGMTDRSPAAAEVVQEGSSMQVDPQHKIGFSQLFADSQASIGGLSPAGVDPGHVIGFSQLFKDSQASLPANSAPPAGAIDSRHKVGFSQLFADSQVPTDVGASAAPPRGVDPRHKVGFSQLFQESQMDSPAIQQKGYSGAAKDRPELTIVTRPGLVPKSAESQDSAAPIHIELSYSAEDSLPVDPVQPPDAVVPPAYADLDYLAQPAVVSDLNARLDTKRETAKELKAKAAQREKAKLEAARALGKKGNDIRSFFAGPKAADPVKPAATLHKSGKSGEPGSETDMFAEDRSDRDDGGDEDAASDGGSGADVDSQDEEGLSEGSAEETGEESSGESEGSDADADADAGEDAPSEPNEGESSIASPSGPASEAPISDTQAAGDDDDEVIVKPKSKKNKSMFVLNEAEEEEDEFQGLGGPDGEDSDDDDGKDLADLIATGKDAEDHAPEELDAILRQHRAELAAKDQEEVNQLLKDVTSGNLRKRGRTGLDGRYLDDDSEDEDLELLKAIRLANDLQRRYGPGKRKRGDDMSVVEKLASNPETAAFGKAFLGDTADKSGFLDWEERKSDAVGVVSTDSAHQSEDDDQYEEDDMERSDEDASSEADTVSERSRNHGTKRIRRTDADRNSLESDLDVDMDAPRSSGSDAEKTRKKKRPQWRLFDEDEDGETKEEDATAVDTRPSLAIRPASPRKDASSDEEGAFEILDRSRKTPRKGRDRLHPDSATKRRQHSIQNSRSLLNRSPGALSKFAKADTNDRLGGKGRTFTVGKSSDSQPGAEAISRGSGASVETRVAKDDRRNGRPQSKSLLQALSRER